MKIKKPFSIAEWEKDKSQTVVTRDNCPVRILCTDANVYTLHSNIRKPIIALIKIGKEEEYSLTFGEDGCLINSNTQTKHDLFILVDEKEELTEIEKAYNAGKIAGKQEILSKIPKWKKADRDLVVEVIDFVVLLEISDGNPVPVVSNRVSKGEYYIDISNLELLPFEGEDLIK